MDDQLFTVFISLYGILQKAGKLTATVDFELTQIERSQSTKPVTLGGFISSMLPQSVKASLRNKAIEKFSAKIGHSLNYKLVWEGAGGRGTERKRETKPISFLGFQKKRKEGKKEKREERMNDVSCPYVKAEPSHVAVLRCFGHVYVPVLYVQVSFGNRFAFG